MKTMVIEIGICAVAVLLSVLFVLARMLSSVRRQNRQLREESRRKTENIKSISEYAQKSREINAAGNEIERRLRSAESDEDVNDIAGGIVAANNQRVCKPSGK